jgi:hypothetical protein
VESLVSIYAHESMSCSLQCQPCSQCPCSQTQPYSKIDLPATANRRQANPSLPRAIAACPSLAGLRIPPARGGGEWGKVGLPLVKGASKPSLHQDAETNADTAAAATNEKQVQILPCATLCPSCSINRLRSGHNAVDSTLNSNCPILPICVSNYNVNRKQIPSRR